jgi:hypothetical protein
MSSNQGNTNAISNTTNNYYNTTINPNISNTDLVYQVFTESNVVILLWFLAIYMLVYFLVNLLRPNAQRGSVVRTFDTVAIGCLFVYLVLSFFQKSDKDKESIVEDGYDSLKDTMNSPLSIFSIAFFILILYTIIFIIGIPMDSTKPFTISIIEYSAWIMFILVIIASFFKYFLGISITDMMDRFFGNLKTTGERANQNIAVAKARGNTAAKGDTVSTDMNEVFNVGNNMYTYDDAQTICTAYGARLATYDEMEEAYDNGAEWCNYGWSENQSAYFPTQKATWNELQKTKDRKNACGRPGINGGYIENPNLRFGVNCYGKKPLPRPEELKALKQSQLPPKSQDDIITDMKVKFWKDNSDKLLQINAYNNNKWSQY